jgi:hypothetical protein
MIEASPRQAARERDASRRIYLIILVTLTHNHDPREAAGLSKAASEAYGTVRATSSTACARNVQRGTGEGVRRKIIVCGLASTMKISLPIKILDIKRSWAISDDRPNRVSQILQAFD